MADRENVISAIEKAKKQSEENAQDRIIVPFREADMILSLLKEQEPKPVKVEKNAYNHKFYYCPKCNRSFDETWFKKPKFCDKCGQAVKWDD